jgi:hypothetical protein
MTRVRSDSVTTAVAAAQAAALGTIRPPSHIDLPDEAIPFWNAIVEARASTTWNPADLALAATLARTQSGINRLLNEIAKEGDTLVNAKGTVTLNPKHNLLEVMTRRVIALSKAVHVHAEATQGRSRDAGNKLAAEKDAKESIAVSDDELIPRLRAV